MPPPIEDELLYGYMARLYVLSGYRRRADFMEAVLGRNMKLLSPMTFGAFDLEAGSFTMLSAGDILNRHSVYPFYRLFLPEQARQAYEVCEWEPARVTRPWISVDELSVGNLRYCPVCAPHQYELIGSTTFLRSHNLPQVHACKEHGVVLQSAVTRLSPDDAAEPFVIPSLLPCSPTKAASGELAYARMASALLAAGMAGTPPSPSTLRKYLQDELHARLGRNMVPKMRNFLRVKRIGFIDTCVENGDLNYDFRRAFHGMGSRWNQPQPAFAVMVLMLLHSESDIPLILSRLAQKEGVRTPGQDEAGANTSEVPREARNEGQPDHVFPATDMHACSF